MLAEKRGLAARLRAGARRTLPWLSVLMVLGAVVFWWTTDASGAGEAPVGRALEVSQGEIRQTAEATGKIEPHVQVEVQPRASGEVSEVLVAEGDEVEAGQVLFRLDARDAERDLEDARVALRRARADVAQARANRDAAQAEAANAEAARAVSERSAAAGLVSSETHRTSTTSARVAEATTAVRQAALQGAGASLAAAQLAVQDAEQRLAEMTVTAPIAGTVLDVSVEVGSIVASALSNVSGGTAMATVADLSDLRVVGAIDEAQIGAVATEQAVEIRVDAYPERTYSGRVERVAPLGVEESNVVTFDVEIVVTDENASDLRSGMSADLSIITGREEGILVPLIAIRSEENGRFVQLTDGTSRPIRTGGTDGRAIVVLEGLEAGDRVLAAPAPTPGSGGERRNALMPGPPRGRGPR